MLSLVGTFKNYMCYRVPSMENHDSSSITTSSKNLFWHTRLVYLIRLVYPVGKVQPSLKIVFTCFNCFLTDLIWKPPYFFQVIQLNNDADKVNLFCRALSVGCFLTILELFQYFHMLQKIYFFQSLLYFCSSLYQGCDILPRYIGL